MIIWTWLPNIPKTCITEPVFLIGFHKQLAQHEVLTIGFNTQGVLNNGIGFKLYFRAKRIKKEGIQGHVSGDIELDDDRLRHPAI
jgi:hypothetical protein